jgi:Xaa-Pro dipeptidase
MTSARIETVVGRLTRPSDLPAPFGETDFVRRRERLSLLLAERGADALFVEPGATARYLAGLEWKPSERLFGLVVLRDGGALVIAPAFERDVLTKRLGREVELFTWDEHEYGYDTLARALDSRGVKTLLFDPATRLLLSERIVSAWKSGRTGSGADVVRILRSIKEPGEIALMRRANELTKHAIATVAPHVEPGMTCRQVAALMHTAQQRLGLENTWDLTLVGPGAADPHGHTDDTVIEKGGLLLCDTGGTLMGYHADCTRTWVVGGDASAEIRRAWDTVFAAQAAALSAFTAGRPSGDVDRAARAVIEAAGYGTGYSAFTHRLGHGIGAEIHEPPYCDSGSQVKLAPGMCFSNEPGIYLRGKFGLRIEDIVCVTAAAPEVFGPRQKGPNAPF